MALLNLSHLRQLDLVGIAITARLQSDGALLPVESAFAKLLAAARSKSFPRIHTVIMSRAQPLDYPELVRDETNARIFKTPHDDFHILTADNLAEAVELLALDTQTRWNALDCALPQGGALPFVGRERLLASVEQFIATHTSGYLVITGALGKGKSALLSELVRRAQECGEQPIYHTISDHASHTSKPHNIAACFYDRLRRKYVLPEPKEWHALDAADKLERLVRHLSEFEWKSTQQRETLYLDAADQVEAVSGEPLIPGTLRTLPRGVVCIITSRPQLNWLQTRRDVTVWNMDDYADDRVDVALYLRAWRQRRAPELSEAWIDKIVEQNQPPVFFTVAELARQWTDSTLTAHQRETFSQPAAWVVPPEILIETEARRVARQIQMHGLSETQLWRTLGIFALAREGLSQEHLQQFDLWQEDVTDAILQTAANFFTPRSGLREPRVPYTFAHAGYHEYVVARLAESEQKSLQQLLGASGARWRELDGMGQKYALRYGVPHLIAARAWGMLDQVLSDMQMFEARFREGWVFEAVEDLAAAASLPIAFTNVADAFTRALEKSYTEAQWLEIRRALYQFFGAYSQWHDALRAALETSRNFDVQRFVAETHDMEARPEHAARIFEMLIQRELPDDNKFAIAHIRLASTYAHLQQNQKALETLDALLVQPNAETRFAADYTWAQYHRAILLHRLGHSARARAMLEQICRTTLNTSVANSALHQLGVIALDANAHERAELLFQTCLQKQEPSEWNHRRAFDHRRLGQVYARTERIEQAHAAFAEALTISRRTDHRRYTAVVQNDIVQYLVLPWLRREAPETISLDALAQRFGIETPYVCAALRVLYQEKRGYVDALDAESAQPSGEVARWDVAHRDGVWHATVIVLVVNSANHVLWQQRSESDSRGKWDVSVAGHCCAGETDLDAAMRESAEELGLEIRHEDLMRVGARGEFCKVGLPTIAQDSFQDATFFLYRTAKQNRERISVFILRVADEERARIATKGKDRPLDVHWAPLAESAHSVEKSPDQFASAFRMLFGNATNVERIVRVFGI